MDYVTFLLDLTAEGDNRAIREAVSYRRDENLRPANAFQWKVTCDVKGRVIVVGLVKNRPTVIATARWHGALAEHKQLEPTTPTTYQWDLVEVAVGAELARRAAIHDRSGEPPVSPRQLEENIEAIEAELEGRPDRAELARAAERRADKEAASDASRRRRRRIAAGASGVVIVATVIGGVVILARTKRPATAEAPVGKRATDPPPTPTPPPRPIPPPPPVVDEPVEVRIAKAQTFAEALALAKPALADTTAELGAGTRLFATYAAAKLRWADVDVPAETTVGHVLKDAEEERGKRMCADGVVASIERRDLGPRKIYVGRLGVADGETIAFVAVGTTGELIKRSTARFCGAVTGKAGSAVAMIGMFDLPENHAPIVEQ